MAPEPNTRVPIEHLKFYRDWPETLMPVDAVVLVKCMDRDNGEIYYVTRYSQGFFGYEALGFMQTETIRLQEELVEQMHEQDRDDDEE